MDFLCRCSSEQGGVRVGVLVIYFSDGFVIDSNDIQERGYDLGQELYIFEFQGFEDEGDGLDNYGVMVREGLVSEDSYQGYYGYSWVEFVQRQVFYVDQYFIGVVVSQDK